MAALVLDRPVPVMLAVYEAMLAEPSELLAIRRFGITADRFVIDCAGATVVGLEVGGELAGGMFFRNDRVHVGILPRHRAVWCRWFKRMLGIGFKLHGSPLRAFVGAGNKAAQRFVERVGCVELERGPLLVEYAVKKERMVYP